MTSRNESTAFGKRSVFDLTLTGRLPAEDDLEYNSFRRAPAHCGMVNLVRSGTKQPQLFPTSAADKARLFIFQVAQFLSSFSQKINANSRKIDASLRTFSMSAPDQKPRQTSFLGTLGAVFWSFVGLRSKKDYEKDVTGLNPVYVVIAALLGVAIFVGMLITIVKMVVP
jgi:hypothetical protein